MPLLDGMQLVQRLAASRQPVPYIIFLAAFGDYAIQAFADEALDYLVKPISKVRFRQSIQRAKQMIRQRDMCRLTERIVAMSGSAGTAVTVPDQPQHMIVWQGAEAVQVKFSEIIWVEAANQYVRIHLNQKSYLLTESLSAFYKKLDQAAFQRTHRSVVINLSYLQRVIKKPNGLYELIMTGDIHLPLARSRKALLPVLLKQQRNE